ncbi:expressed unknown protein [Ectocarpus siliculosus]|uniref:Uncharacterized protein n=1 Tax=Ectocarpus siliculosus TaxID=2880 RepID=D7FXB8_ECTSI|nr:expressed unknown protein [Ectocarpus siliculosus]|eukprot:CBJ32255.1 expressed unknown protein [Ectocarpus siliculosus]
MCAANKRQTNRESLDAAAVRARPACRDALGARQSVFGNYRAQERRRREQHD